MSTDRSKDRASLCTFTFPMAAAAVPLAAPAIRLSVPATLARRLRLLPAIKPEKTSLTIFPASSCRLAISVQPSAASSLPSPRARSNRRPPPPSPISPRLLSKPSLSPNTSTSMLLVPITGAEPSVLRLRSNDPRPNKPLFPLSQPLHGPKNDPIFSFV